MHFSDYVNTFLFFEGKKHGEDDEKEGDDVVPSESLRFEDRNHDDSEHRQRDSFLYDFQLNEVEWASILHGADAVGRNHEGILEQSDSPRHQNDKKERPVL